MRIFYVRLLPTNDIVRVPLLLPACSNQFTHCECVAKSIHIYQLCSAKMFGTRNRIVYSQKKGMQIELSTLLCLE